MLLAVLAHPDDETFRCGGTLALLAQRGVRVQVLTATRGEAGSCGDPPLCSRQHLGEMREAELRCACRALGVDSPLIWDYADGALADADEDAATARLESLMRELRPEVLFTWPSHGLSGHPDHQAVSRWTTTAFQRASAEGVEALDALYHLAVPHSVAEALELRQLHAVMDERIDVTIDVTSVWEQKLAAIRCHRTQQSESPILKAPEARQRLFLGREHFQRSMGRACDDLLALL